MLRTILDRKLELAEIEFFAQSLQEDLPHGSGIDLDWSYYIQKNGKIVFMNSYHGMNEHGYYDDWADFKLTIDPMDPETWRFNFRNDPPRWKSWFCGLGEYLEDAIQFALEASYTCEDCGCDLTPERRMRSRLCFKCWKEWVATGEDFS